MRIEIFFHIIRTLFSFAEFFAFASLLSTLLLKHFLPILFEKKKRITVFPFEFICFILSGISLLNCKHMCITQHIISRHLKWITASAKYIVIILETLCVCALANNYQLSLKLIFERKTRTSRIDRSKSLSYRSERPWKLIGFKSLHGGRQCFPIDSNPT